MKHRMITYTAMIGGDHSDMITFTAPNKAGDYEYICTFREHFGAGMMGTLTVSPTH